MSCQSPESESSGNLEPDEFREKQKLESGVVIDVRTLEEYENGYLELADHQFDFLSGEFEQKMEKLDKDETYYLYCRSGARSGKARELMEEAGFERVYNIGGYEDLVSAGFSSRDPS